MDGEVKVKFRGSENNASGHIVAWKSDGEYSDADESFYSQDGTYTWHDEHTLRPGNFLYVMWHPDSMEHFCALIQVPSGADFERFCAAAQEAEKNHWSRGRWALEFSVATWDINDGTCETLPADLAEALAQYAHTQQSS